MNSTCMILGVVTGFSFLNIVVECNQYNSRHDSNALSIADELSFLFLLLFILGRLDEEEEETYLFGVD
jgi:hypothetical protein